MTVWCAELIYGRGPDGAVFGAWWCKEVAGFPCCKATRSDVYQDWLVVLRLNFLDAREDRRRSPGSLEGEKSSWPGI